MHHQQPAPDAVVGAVDPRKIVARHVSRGEVRELEIALVEGAHGYGLATRELLDHVLLDLLIAGHLEDTDEPLSIEPGNVRRGAARSTFGPTDDGFPWQSDRKARPKHPRDRLHEDALAIRSKPIMEHENTGRAG